MNINFLGGISIIILLLLGFSTAFFKNRKTLNHLAYASTVSITAVMIYCLVNFSTNASAFSLPFFGSIGINFCLNEFGAVFSLISCALFAVSFLVAENQFPTKTKLTRFYSSTLIIFASVLGVFFADDLFTLFIFFEIMSMASYLWVIQNGGENATLAGKKYLAYAVGGGLVLLTGIIILAFLTGDLTIKTLPKNTAELMHNPLLYISGVLMFIGFGTKAGLFLLNDWLSPSYTQSPTPTTALFSGILSKTGVYGGIIVVVNIFSESEIFILVALIFSILTMLTGAIYAFASKNLIQTIAYSSISQIGFIFWGISLTALMEDHNLYAALGTVFHTVNHSFIKLSLFCLCSVIFKACRSEDLNRIKGFGRNKPWLKFVFAVSALALAGIPLFSGYVSKTLLHEAMVELIHIVPDGAILLTVFEWLFLLSGGFTFAYMLKLYICIFVRRGYGEQCSNSYISSKAKVALTLVTLFMLALGIAPNFIFAKIGEFTAEFLGAHYDHEIHYFTRANLQGSAISIALGLLLYFGVAEKSVADKTKAYRDFSLCEQTVEKRLYIPIAKKLGLIFSVILRLFDIITDIVIVVLNRLFFKSVKIPKSFMQGDEKNPDHISDGIQISYSLSYSLLLFGLGLLFTLLYLLTLGSN